MIRKTKIVPQLHETTAWLAGMRQELFDLVVESDPEVLLRTDLTSAGPRYRATLVGSLLKCF